MAAWDDDQLAGRLLGAAPRAWACCCECCARQADLCRLSWLSFRRSASSLVRRPAQQFPPPVRRLLPTAAVCLAHGEALESSRTACRDGEPAQHAHPPPRGGAEGCAAPGAPLREPGALFAVQSTSGSPWEAFQAMPKLARRPPLHPPPPPPSQENTAPLPSAGLQRKRKGISPAGKSGPLAKRATVASTAAAPSGRPLAVPVPSEDNIWEAVAEETGWTLTDCLSHKVAFAKRADAKAKVGSGGRGAAVG